MNERLKAIRKALKCSQVEFGAKLGLNQSTIAGYETGIRQLSSATIIAICKEYNVNEQWLRTGEGDMFRPVSRDEEIMAFVGDALSDTPNFRQRFLSVLARMTPAEWEMVQHKAEELLEDTKKDGESSPSVGQE